MCDTVVSVDVDGGGVWLAKNSDREPGEAQLVEHIARTKRGGRVKCTHIEIDDVDETLEVSLSRPFWMWGAEMGVNEAGVAIGNEAVFTSERLDAAGLTGMDLLRLALERATSAKDAVDVMTALLRRHGQGGRMGYRDLGFRYSSSFIVADAREAWVLETAGRRFAAQRVARGVRSISNALTITNADVVDDPMRGKDFRARYDKAAMSALAGASTRAACTTRLAGSSFDAMARALRDHAGHEPGDGLVMSMPCAHASLVPTRTAGQTTGSMIVHLVSTGAPRVWFTGTSSPCISVFKPVPIATGALLDSEAVGQQPGAGYDDASLWWRHERLHRAALASSSPSWFAATAAVLERAALLERTHLDATGDAANAAWAEHRALVDEWRALVPSTTRDGASLLATSRPAFHWYWRRQSALDRVPA